MYKWQFISRGAFGDKKNQNKLNTFRFKAENILSIIFMHRFLFQIQDHEFALLSIAKQVPFHHEVWLTAWKSRDFKQYRPALCPFRYAGVKEASRGGLG